MFLGGKKPENVPSPPNYKILVIIDKNEAN